MATRKKTNEIIFPDREATMRDVARFSVWAGINVHIEVTPIQKKSRKRKVDPKKPRA